MDPSQQQNLRNALDQGSGKHGAKHGPKGSPFLQVAKTIAAAAVPLSLNVLSGVLGSLAQAATKIAPATQEALSSLSVPGVAKGVMRTMVRPFKP